jgi:hypothetical protein
MSIGFVGMKWHHEAGVKVFDEAEILEAILADRVCVYRLAGTDSSATKGDPRVAGTARTVPSTADHIRCHCPSGGGSAVLDCLGCFPLSVCPVGPSDSLGAQEPPFRSAARHPSA